MVHVEEEAIGCGAVIPGSTGCYRKAATFSTPEGWNELDGEKFGGLTGEKLALK